MQLDYAIEGYWLAKHRDLGTNTVNDYTLTFRRLTELVGKTRELKHIRNGGNLLALQDLLGHERMDTVRIYAEQAEVDLERQQKGASPADRWRL